MYHNFAVKGDSVKPTEIVPAPKQREILALLLNALDPASLAIPEKLLACLTVVPEGEGGGGRGRLRGPDLESNFCYSAD